MKKSSLYLVLFAALGLSTMASADEMADHIFSETISGEIHALSDEEMQSTQGEWGPYGAFGGGVVGGVGYAGYAIGNGSWSWPSFGAAVGGGALTGFTGGASAWYYVPRGLFGMGVGTGISNYHGY